MKKLSLKLSLLLYICLIYINQVKGQEPTMQVACGISGGPLEYVDLVKSHHNWYYTQDNGGSGGRINAKNEFVTYGGELIGVEPRAMQVLENGYPTHSPIALSNGNNAHPTLWIKLTANGTHTLLVEGAGTIRFRNIPAEHITISSSEYTFTDGQRIEFTTHGLTVPDNSGYPSTTGSGSGRFGDLTIWIELSESDTNNPIQNIRVLPPDYTDSQGVVHHFEDEYLNQPFHPKLIEDMQKYTIMRFMDQVKTNNSTVRHWSEMLKHGEIGSRPTSYFDMISLGNHTNTDIWLTIPHLATDGFVDTLATLVKDNLDPGLKAYIEYSNEVWNSMFDQTPWAREQGMTFGWSDDPGAKYYTRRTGEIFSQFTKIFNNDRNRIILVCAWQMGSKFNDFGEYYNDPLINPGGAKPDVFANAPYFSPTYNQNSIGVEGECLWQTCDDCVANNVPSVNEILDTMQHSIRNMVAPLLRSAKAASLRFGIPLINYEGGPHVVGSYGAENSCELTDNIARANRSDRMHDVYREWMDTVRSAGVSVLNQFVDCARWSKWGCWGLTEYRGQDDASAKYRALTGWLQDNPVVFDTEMPTQPGVPILEETKATSISISWQGSSDNGELIGYDIFVDGVLAGSSSCQEVNTKFTISDLAPNTTYTITVKARDFGGNYSLESPVLSATTETYDIQKPSTVINLETVYKTFNSIKISWTPSSDDDKVEKYIIDWGTAQDSTGELNYTITGLLESTNYKISVFAKDPSGNISDSSYIFVTTDPFPILKAKPVSTVISIDGILDEQDWTTFYPVSNLVLTSDIIDDDSIKISVLWDQNYLYIGANAIDNNLIQASSFWNGDGFEFMIDGNYNRSSTYEDGYDVKYTVQWNGADIYGNETTDVLYEYSTTNIGWACEFAIPWSKIGISSPVSGTTMGFDVIYNDCDASRWGRDRQYTIAGDRSIYNSCEQFADLILDDDITPPTVASNLEINDITMGSAIVSWNASSDASGIKGYLVFINGIQQNTDLVTNTNYSIKGLQPTSQYTVSIIAIDNNDNQSNISDVQFTTLEGNLMVNFNSEENSLANYSVVRTVEQEETTSKIPFTTEAGTELFGAIPEFNLQYEIKGGLLYEHAAPAADNTNLPSIRQIGTSYEPGILHLFTGNENASNFTGILMWTKDKFLNENATWNNLAFDNTARSKLVIKMQENSNPYGFIRFLVKAGEQYFISENVFPAGADEEDNVLYELSAFSDNIEINKRWAVYDPSSLKMPEYNTMNFSAVNLSNVQEVGFIFSIGRPAWGYSYNMVQFMAYGVQESEDTQAPLIPDGLNASNTTLSSFLLNWNPSSDNVAVAYYEVFLDGMSVGTTTTNSYLFEDIEESSIYSLTVEAVDNAGNRSGLSEALSVQTSSNLGIEIINEKEIKLYPNPANENCTLEIGNVKSSNFPTIKIIDMSGRTHFIKKTSHVDNKITIPISQLANGIYNIEIKTKNKSFYRKLIVDRNN